MGTGGLAAVGEVGVAAGEAAAETSVAAPSHSQTCLLTWALDLLLQQQSWYPPPPPLSLLVLAGHSPLLHPSSLPSPAAALTSAASLRLLMLQRHYESSQTGMGLGQRCWMRWQAYGHHSG